MPPSVMAGLPALKEAFSQMKTRMDKAVSDFGNNLASTRTGRANVHMLDQVKVEAYGADMPLNQVAQVHAPEPNMILVQPFDPSLIAEIEKGLRAIQQGFNPQNDGKVVREDHRTAVRNIRRDGNELIKKAAKEKKISEDEEKRSLEEMQKITDEEIRRMEEMCRAKEKEVMTV